MTTTQPDKYIAVARNLIDHVKKDGFTEDELKNEKTGYLTGLYYRQETNEEQAAALATNEVVHNNWKRAIEIKDEINKVTLQDANNAFKKYITNITCTPILLLFVSPAPFHQATNMHQALTEEGLRDW